jgi:hypothetical protein
MATGHAAAGSGSGSASSSLSRFSEPRFPAAAIAEPDVEVLGVDLHYPFDADVIANTGDANSFAEIYWEDKIMPFIGGTQEANESLSRAGIILPTEAIYRCPSDPSIRAPFVEPVTGKIAGVKNRTSFLMNSL